MRLLYILAFFCLTYIHSNAQPANWSWATSVGGNAQFQYYLDIDKDDQGNSYVIGEFTGTRDFGTISLTASASTQVFVAKLDSTGNVLWARALGYTLLNSYAGGIAVNDGHVYIAGGFTAYIEIDTILLSGLGQTDIFVAQLDTATGACQWLQGASSPYQDKPIDMVRAVGGGVILTGTFTNTVIFGNDTLVNPSNFFLNSFLARYYDDGTCAWARAIGSNSRVDAYAVAQSRNGQIAITGAYLGNATFGNSISVSNGATTADVFVTKYDSTGVPVWAKSGGGSGNDSGQGVGMDDDGAVYVIGGINGQTTFSPLSLSDNGAGNILIIKYSTTGTPVWAKSEGGSQFDTGNKIYTDHLGSSYVTGIFTGSANFSGNNLSGTNDAFIAKYSPTGLVRWITKAGGGNGSDQGLSIRADSAGICYVGGTYTGTGTFGTFSLSSPTNEYAVYIGLISGGTVGLEQITTVENFAIYPNPGHELLNIRSDNDGAFISGISIFSMDGKKVYHQSTDDVLFKTIDISTLPTGVYQVQLESEGKLVQMRFVKG